MLSRPAQPHEIYQELFHEIQMAEIFDDSKTFVDAVPKLTPDIILKKYRDVRQEEGFDLRDFVDQYFELPTEHKIAELQIVTDVSAHVNRLWTILKRDQQSNIEGSTLITLPRPYIVPGGRFREIYYWDSYFTMLGLEVSGEHQTISDMVENFAWQIDEFGHIPNGNRSYYVSRSQPPFFSHMVSLLAQTEGPAALRKYCPQLKKEYDFWMDETGRMVKMPNGSMLNRYYDELTIPRAESYREDYLLGGFSETISVDQGNSIMRNIRAACESGWDFSSRWLVESERLETIQTTDFIPVDLNCLMLHLERTLSSAYKEAGNAEQSQIFQNKALDRIAAIQEYLWDEQDRVFYDYNFQSGKTTGRASMAMFFPLYAGFANEDQAASVVKFASANLLAPGGWLTTSIQSGQQWDAPNGWPPLQWIAFVALKNYGFDDLAEDAAKRWLKLNEDVYTRTGKMMEKYNVADLSLDAGGGEYPVQDGFGWTNGVYLKLVQALHLHQNPSV